jgi:hypothetical protein
MLKYFKHVSALTEDVESPWRPTRPPPRTEIGAKVLKAPHFESDEERPSEERLDEQDAPAAGSKSPLQPLVRLLSARRSPRPPEPPSEINGRALHFESDEERPSEERLDEQDDDVFRFQFFLRPLVRLLSPRRSQPASPPPPTEVHAAAFRAASDDDSSIDERAEHRDDDDAVATQPSPQPLARSFSYSQTTPERLNVRWFAGLPELEPRVGPDRPKGPRRTLTFM